MRAACLPDRRAFDLFTNYFQMKKVLLGLVFCAVLFCSYQVSQPKLSDCEKANQRLEANKKLVADFYQQLFGDKDISAIQKYIGDVYIQHNPSAADGPQALTDVCKAWFKNAPKEKIDIQHIGADGDMVFIHLKSHMGSKIVSVVDMFRIKDGKIIEHWDVMQDVPDKSANPHPMF
jgi:predicted SnoaL-like aldol condensation-catalyzing enzyme